MSQLIDFHSLCLPNPPFDREIDEIKERIKPYYDKTSPWLHFAQKQLRDLPPIASRVSEEVGYPLLLSRLLMESSLRDLQRQLDENSISYAMVVAKHGLLNNEQLMEICESDSRLIPCMRIPKKINEPDQVIQDYYDQGVRFIKLTPPLEAFQPMSSHYLSVLKKANELQMSIILHTGIIQSRLFFKRPELGDVEQFNRWFEMYPRLRFYLAHMNLNEPEKAIVAAENFENLSLLTSHQSLRDITEAVDRIGAERVLFASDWPFIGDNIRLSLKKIKRGKREGHISSGEAAQILGENAEKLFKSYGIIDS